MSDSPVASSPRFGILGRLRASLDDRTFFRRGTVFCLGASAAVLAVLHTLGVLGGLWDFFKIGDWGQTAWLAAVVVTGLGVLSGWTVGLWTARRASDIGKEADGSLLRQGFGWSEWALRPAPSGQCWHSSRRASPCSSQVTPVGRSFRSCLPRASS